MRLYVATENSDLTEGKGHTVVTGVYLGPDKAVEAVKGRAPMGYGDGDVYVVDLVDGVFKGSLISSERRYYGYRRIGNKLGYGYVSWANDPEYEEFLRLREKFEG